MWKPTQARNCMKNIIGNVEYIFLVVQFLQNQSRLGLEEGHLQHLIQHAVSYVIYYTY
jgi:hypothetical protein